MSDENERITDLEFRLMHQEAALEELTRQSLAQERTIKALAARIEQLTNALSEVRERLPASSPADERPPHY